MSSEIRAGIIGFGTIGRLHLRASERVPEVRVVAVAESNAEAREAAPPDVERFADYRDLLALDLDLVTICLPTALHFPVTLDALAAGKHVLMEKPITATYTQGGHADGRGARPGPGALHGDGRTASIRRSAK